MDIYGENSGKKTKVSMNFPEKVNFQTYIELLKQQKMTWNAFETVIKDLSYSDISKLKHLNAILVTELTANFSDIDRSRYLNSILLTEFKEFTYREGEYPNIANEYFLEESEKYYIDSDKDEQLVKEHNEIELEEVLKNERYENSDTSYNNDYLESNQNTANEYFAEESEKTSVDSDRDEQEIKEDTEIEKNEMIENEQNDDLDKSSKENSIESNGANPENKIF